MFVNIAWRLFESIHPVLQRSKTDGSWLTVSAFRDEKRSLSAYQSIYVRETVYLRHETESFFLWTVLFASFEESSVVISHRQAVIVSSQMFIFDSQSIAITIKPASDATICFSSF